LINNTLQVSLNQFYADHLAGDYVMCTCKYCAQLTLKFCIKKHRKPSEFEFLHKRYLKVFKEKEREAGEGNNLNNFKLFMF
jgi:hypothetical protein